VYRLLGMANDVDDPRFPETNYDKSALKVYQEITVYYITTSYGYMLDILGHYRRWSSRRLESQTISPWGKKWTACPSKVGLLGIYNY